MWPALVVIAAALLFLPRRSAPLVELEPEPLNDDTNQLPTIWETAAVTLTPANPFAPPVAPVVADTNRRAFLDMIAASEGTNRPPDGYRAMFGYPAEGRVIADLSDHPRRYFEFTDKAGRTLKTSAAGRYQFLARTWDELAQALHLSDFGPESQDAAALELIRRRGALDDVDAGRVAAAVVRCAPIWASLPGAGYNQPERKITFLLSAFTDAGGTLEA